MLTTQQDTREAKVHLDGMLDLQTVPSAEHWDRIATAVQRLDSERGRSWRLKLLVSDTPEGAGELPRLVRRLGHAGLRHDSNREPGGVQGIVVAPREAGRGGPVPLAA
ncbi:MAG: hypothetical protein ACRDI2_04510 [Chloroflexota bacterium]